jgi:large subunit ribosomal protein L10
MKKLGILFKESSESRIKKSLKESNSFFIVRYSGLSGPDLNTLRQSLRSTRAELFVIRNNIAKRALKDFKNEELLKLIEGPSGFVFAKEEPVGTSKILYNFSKEHENLKLEGGFLNDRIINKKDIEVLAKLPSREVLIAQALMAMKSPITGLVMVLKGNLKKFVYCIEQIKTKKSTVDSPQTSAKT